MDNVKITLICSSQVTLELIEAVCRGWQLFVRSSCTFWDNGPNYNKFRQPNFCCPSTEHLILCPPNIRFRSGRITKVRLTVNESSAILSQFVQFSSLQYTNCVKIDIYVQYIVGQKKVSPPICDSCSNTYCIFAYSACRLGWFPALRFGHFSAAYYFLLLSKTSVFVRHRLPMFTILCRLRPFYINTTS